MNPDTVAGAGPTGPQTCIFCLQEVDSTRSYDHFQDWHLGRVNLLISNFKKLCEDLNKSSQIDGVDFHDTVSYHISKLESAINNQRTIHTFNFRSMVFAMRLMVENMTSFFIKHFNINVDIDANELRLDGIIDTIIGYFKARRQDGKNLPKLKKLIDKMMYSSYIALENFDAAISEFRIFLRKMDSLAQDCPTSTEDRKRKAFEEDSINGDIPIKKTKAELLPDPTPASTIITPDSRPGKQTPETTSIIREKILPCADLTSSQGELFQISKSGTNGPSRDDEVSRFIQSCLGSSRSHDRPQKTGSEYYNDDAREPREEYYHKKMIFSPYKTALCAFHQEGFCHHGEKCTFAHGVDDIRCRFFAEGYCYRGRRCTFRHV